MKKYSFGCHIGYVYYGSLAYADDIILMSPTILGTHKLLSIANPGKKAWWKKSLVEKMAVERSGKKAWWKESLVCFGKDGKKVWCLFFTFDT